MNRNSTFRFLEPMTSIRFSSRMPCTRIWESVLVVRYFVLVKD